MKRLLAVALCFVVPATLFAADNSYKVAYDGGSVGDISAGVGLKLYIDSNQIHLVRDKTNVVTIPASSVTEISYGQDVHANHTVYLGCLNCSEYRTDSVKNTYGTHGSPYSQDSIFNHYGQYGSPYSAESACNEYASDPPVIVDQNGKYYGRLTLNRYAPEIALGASLMGWLAAVCHG